MLHASSDLDLSRPNIGSPASRQVATPLERVEGLMRELAHGGRQDLLGSIVEEHLETGGKRIRARLALTAGASLGVLEHDAVVWAAACEMMHNASLVHDDLQDGDTVRRGFPTTWVRHGMGQAINAGDLMLMLPFRAIERMRAPDSVRWALVSALARRAEETVRGQADEMDLIGSGGTDWGSYISAVRGKTAAFFALPVWGAVVLSGRASEADAIALPFAEIGVLFQLQDDLVDLWGDKGRGERGNDLREGKVSALVARHLQLAPRDEGRITAILRAPRSETKQADVEWAARRFVESGARSAVLGDMAKVVDHVSRCAALRALPGLAAVADSLVEASLNPIGPLWTEWASQGAGALAAV